MSSWVSFQANYKAGLKGETQHSFGSIRAEILVVPLMEVVVLDEVVEETVIVEDVVPCKAILCRDQIFQTAVHRKFLHSWAFKICTHAWRHNVFSQKSHR